MTAVTSLPAQEVGTLADLLEQLGNVPLNRIRVDPPPGTATEEHVIRAEGHTGRCCELIDGVLVEKTMGYLESLLAGAILEALRQFARTRNLGIVLGADGTLRILPRQVRIPDVCFIRWDRFPGGKLPQVPIPSIAPDLAVEVLSSGNTEAEMERKLREYFEAGTELVWYVDPASRSVTVYTAPNQSTVLDADATLTGGDVLPGFTLSLRDLFAETGEAT
ncbi:MAG: Uma2 family endonuclease [Planctomycetes bacterium]|nr:Uma2 family endonuclease [Planctomycetota bacterium]MBL7041324.1 Uma2 family endonuclease [Pirellulaceae bacterium]